MSEIRTWLESIGLGQYPFETNDIDTDVLRRIDDQARCGLSRTVFWDRGRRDKLSVDTFAVLTARYCMQTVSTHH